MVLKTAIFVDGANFRGNLRSFEFFSRAGDDPRPYRLEERHFDWQRFFAGALKKFDEATGWEHQLQRVHWYHAASISPWSYSEREQRRRAQMVVQDNPHVASLTDDEVIGAANSWYRRERDRFERLREQTFENIQRRVNFLEFKYVGQYRVDPFRPYRISRNPTGELEYLGRQVGEKGVDIGIAVDMIAMMPYYDVAVLVSGDADFLPAVTYVKDHLKYVYQFSVAKGTPPDIAHLSPFLRSRMDCVAAFDEIELLGDYLDRRSGIPDAILQAIDARISALTTGASSVQQA